MNNRSANLARTIADYFHDIPQVSAIALGGSTALHTRSTGSDIDLYIFTTSLIPQEIRRDIVQRRGATRQNLNLDYWDLGDEWFDKPTGIEVDVMYWDTRWIEDQIDRVLIHHQASLGYSTCHWHTIKNAAMLYDRQDWFALLQAKCNQPYPSELRNAIITRNFPVLRDIIPSYTSQLKKAISRKDLVSINHRLTAFLASYFDILFALNQIPHPGEKRLLELAPVLCKQVPDRMVAQISRLLQVANLDSEVLIIAINDLVDNLLLLLEKNKFKL